MRRRTTVAAAALALIATACAGERPGASSPPNLNGDLRYADVSSTYQARLTEQLDAGRAVVDQLVSGRIDAVYPRVDPEVRAGASVAEVERVFADFRATASIGGRLEEKAALQGPGRGVYWADHQWGRGRLRFTVAFTPTGLVPDASPVQTFPADPRATEPAQAELRLPFDGLWLVGEGPTPEIGAHHLTEPDQRHAYDFVIWRNGSTYQGTGAENSDSWCWGEPVLSPGAGRVVAMANRVADNRPGRGLNTAQALGNHVVIDLGREEFAVVAHLQQGSVKVAKGDQVQPGQRLGSCGNSGSSTAPHVHFHVQDKPTFQTGAEVGIPLHFKNYQADGVARNSGAPSSGQFVASAGASP